MKILYATSEAVPFCKTGGLADVSGSLPKTLAEEGEEVAVILPLYRSVRQAYGDRLESLGYTYVDLAWRRQYCGMFRLRQDGVTWLFVDNEQYFDRDGLYGHFDDAERFAFFSRAVLSTFDLTGFRPEVIHCSDWQTALIPVYIQDENARSDYFKDIRTVLTIHNIEYQGRFGRPVLSDVCGLDQGWFDDGTLRFDDDVNFLKGAILCADAVTTVSPTYAQQLKDPAYAHGLHGVLQSCSHKLFGVLNGIDTVRYDPATDRALQANYGPDDLSGKAADKAYLQRRLGLPEASQTPLIAMVTRLVGHKGLDLVAAVGEELMHEEVQLAVLGTGEAGFEQYFQQLRDRWPGKTAVYFGYDAQLAQELYAGADLFLMPSRSEPCGLSQMIAMRYGTVPIVRETGGLKDTVRAYEAWSGEGNGFTFANYDAGDMLYVIREALDLYRRERPAFAQLQRRGMTADFSWRRSARDYMRIYRHAAGR
ncbi:MAG: glycogen synthase GlgA [Oscillospiraceae bacterium]